MGPFLMAMAKQDINDFRARVKRINNPRNKSYYDPDLGMNIPKRVTRRRVKQNHDEEQFLGKFIVSALLGAIAVMFAEVMRIRYFALPEGNNTGFYLELFITFWALLMLTALLDRRRATERFGQIVGIALMFTAGHNLIWRWPDQMAYIYTAEHVEEVMDTTTQHSIVVSGNVYGL